MTSELQDRYDIAQVIIRYATSVDQRDLARYATCFTDDVVVSGFGDEVFTDRTVYVAWVERALSRYGATHHQISTQEVTVEGDRAPLRSYIQATHVLADDVDTFVVLWGIYDDQLVRTDDGWKITHHTLERLIPPRRFTAVG